MKFKLMTIVLIFALAFGFMGSVQPARAGAIDLSWAVSVTYQNVGTAATQVNVDFYAEDSSTAITFNPLAGVGDGTLAAGAGASFFIGNVAGVTSGFKGNAVITTSEPVVATIVQFHQNAAGETVTMRMLSNGFQSTDASTTYLIATTLGKKFDRTTVFSIQNTTDAAVAATLKFYDADNNGALASEITHNIPAYSSKYIRMDDQATTGINMTSYPTGFNGSAIITTNGGAVVAAASELYVTPNRGANFEGLATDRAASTIYMATGLCKNSGLDTYYAVQNAGDQPTTVTVDYYNSADGQKKATDSYKNPTTSVTTLGPGQKWSVNTCKPSDGTDMTNFTGSAVVSSGGQNLVVLGKAQCSSPAGCADSRYTDVFTIFMGEKQGASKLALPFVRWAADARFSAATNLGSYQRSYLAIQNLEATETVVDVKYFDKVGTLCGTHTLTIPAKSKGTSRAPLATNALGCGSMNPDEFGYYTDGTFGGSVLIEAAAANPNAKLIAIARVQNPGAGEDYNAVPVP